MSASFIGVQSLKILERTNGTYYGGELRISEIEAFYCVLLVLIRTKVTGVTAALIFFKLYSSKSLRTSHD